MDRLSQAATPVIDTALTVINVDVANYFLVVILEMTRTCVHFGVFGSACLHDISKSVAALLTSVKVENVDSVDVKNFQNMKCLHLAAFQSHCLHILQTNANFVLHRRLQHSMFIFKVKKIIRLLPWLFSIFEDLTF